MAVEKGRQEHEPAAHILSSEDSEVKTGAGLVLTPVFSPGHQPLEWCWSHSGWVFPDLVTLTVFTTTEGFPHNLCFRIRDVGEGNASASYASASYHGC